MEKNKKKKFRDIRNAVVMMCVMIAMMSTASYAWFTMSSSPTVTGMEMTAATAGGGLLVARDETLNGNAERNYQPAITISDDTKIEVLKPVTPETTEGAENLFKGPVYTGEQVTGFVPIKNTDAIKGYVAKYTYWLKETTTSPDDTKTVNVGIICGDSMSEKVFGLNDTTPILPGSFVRKSINQKDKDASKLNPSYAIRVGFVVTPENGTPGDMIIWEPNQDGENDNNVTLSMATVADGAKVTETIALKSNKDGSIAEGGSGNTSDTLFTIAQGGEVKVEMYVWLEGSDTLCANEVQAGYLEAQVQFTVLDKTTTD